MSKMSDHTSDLLAALSATVSAVPASQARDSDPQPALLLLTDQRPAATQQRSLLAALRNRNAPRSVAPPQPEEVVAEVRASVAVARRDRKPTPASPTAPLAPWQTVQRPFFALPPPQRSATAAPPAPPPPAAPFPASQRNRPAAVADLFAPQPTGGNPYAVALLSGSDLFHGTPASPQAAKATRCKRWFLLNDCGKYFSSNGEFLHHRSFAFAYRNRDAAAFVASKLPASIGRVRVETR